MNRLQTTGDIRLITHVDRPTPQLLLQAHHLIPEAVTLGLELGDAVTKASVLGDGLGCILRVDQTRPEFALAGAERAHPLRLGGPLAGGANRT